MTITLPGHGRRLVRCLLAVFLAGLAALPAWSQDVDHEPDAVFRGQSTYVGGWNQSLPAGSSVPIGVAPSPWIVVSQETVPAQSYATSPYRVSQLPSDPFGQPFNGGLPGYGTPGAGDPNLPGMFLDTPAIWQPYVSAQGKLGSERSVGIGQLMMPLYQDGQTLFFADIRGRIDDANNTEGNFGLAVRSMVDPTWFIGMNGFFDYRRTEHGNNFSQGTIGVEGMSVRYEARLNGYLPETTAKAANSLSTAEFIGNTIFVKGGLERAYYGVDGEIGALLWDDGIGSNEFRGFIGGYWFDTQGKDFPSVAGPKGRLEFRSYDLPWFGPESRLTLGVELQHDNVRDFQVSGIARLEIPLGFFQGARKLTRLERRMLDRIVRDDDIITVAQQGPKEVGRDSLTNRLLNNVLVVDQNTPNIAAVVAGAANPATSTVVVNGLAGPITSNNIIVQGGQVFRGGGFKVIGSETGAVATFGTRPTITNASNVIDTVILANNNSTVADLDLIGGRRGIFGNAALTGILVSGNTVTRSFDDGMRFTALDATSTIQNNIIQSSGRDAAGAIVNAAADGIEINGTFAGTAKGNIATNNARVGILADNLSGTIVGNTANGNGFAGIVVNVDMLASSAISGNTTNNNGNTPFVNSAGITVFRMLGGTISGNTMNNNGRDATGAIVVANSDGLLILQNVDGTISNNTATNNANRGFEFRGNLGATGQVTGNTATNNGNFGFSFAGPTAAGSVVSNNIARLNGIDAAGTVVSANVDGFAFFGNVSGTISGNTSENNTQAGYFITSLQAAGSVINNTATNNPFAGFVFDTGVAGTVSGNTATGSTNGYGFDFLNGSAVAPLAATARVMNNVAFFNKGGFGFDGITAGSMITGNTASSNGFTSNGTPFDATANGFDLFLPNNGTFTGNTAFRNANNGFAGGADNNFNNAAAGTFSLNIANENGDKGYRGANAGTAANNTGTGNTNAGNTFP